MTKYHLSGIFLVSTFKGTSVKHTSKAIFIVLMVFMSFGVVFGQALVNSYGLYVNGDKSIERIVTFENEGYVFVEDPVSGQKYELFFPEGPNEQKNGSTPLLANIWVAVQIREIRLKQDTACFHYFLIEAGKIQEFGCDINNSDKGKRKNQVSVQINALSAAVKKELLEFRYRAKSVWPTVKFPE